MKDVMFILRKKIIDDKLIDQVDNVYFEEVEALRAIKKSPPKVVVIDLGLINIPGIELIKMIRSNLANHHLKIVAVSSKYGVKLVQMAYDAGADFYLTLPAKRSTIEKIVELWDLETTFFTL